MAASSSSSSLQSRWKYDVFISFRGEDTRQNFVSHLHAALRRKNILTYVDERLERGDEISSSLLKAIEESRVSIIVFSKNYATSSWCLDELVHIRQCNKDYGQVIIPIFYDVNPSHVRHQQGCYANAFAGHEKRFKDTIVNEWRAALTTTANLSGWDSLVTRPESTLIDKIVDDILRKLSHLSPSEDLSHLVGIEKRFKQIELLLDIGSQDSRTIGIWGMGGIGKTTLARVVYDRLSTQFKSRCFLANVREESEKHGLDYLENKLFNEVLEEKGNPTAVNPFTKARLRRTKLLIVFDDVSDLKQLEHLVGDGDRFGNGSRIIITTRNMQILRAAGVVATYEVEKLDSDESRELFINAAFPKYSATVDPAYIELIERMIFYLGGIPLAYKVMGSYLRARSIRKWESVLNKLKEDPSGGIHNVLRISYNGLDENSKESFLDIACFFKGLNRDHLSGFVADIEIEDLIDKSLITIKDNKIWMHNLVQEMGYRIVYQESPKPEKRSRLWNAQDVYHVLKNNKGTEAIKGIFLDMGKNRELSLAPTVFQKMVNLRILHISNFDDRENCKISLRQGLQTLPNTLRYLHWDAFPLSYLPSNFTGENLIKFVMAHSQLEQLRNDVMDLGNLRELDLHCSKRLSQIPDLSKASNLETVNLQECTSLTQVPSQIWCLEKLKSINIRACTSLMELPELPTTLLNINLSCPKLERLPSCIGTLRSLQSLDLTYCGKLRSLPDISKFTNLKELFISGCERLEYLPEILEPMSHLTDFQSSRTAIKEIPASLIENLVGLKYLKLDMSKNLEFIPNSIQNMTSLQGITLRGCSKLKVLAKLPLSLRFLDTHGCTSLVTVLSSRRTLRKDWDEYELLGGRFVFYGCFKLDQNVRHIIMAEAQLKIFSRAITSSKLRGEDQESVSSYSVCCPGNQFPQWFKHQSRGSSMSIKLRQDWSSTDFLGFALCAVVDCKDFSSFDGDLNLLCRLRCVTDNNDCYSWESCSVWGDRLPSLGCGRWGLCRDFNWGSLGNNDQTANSSHVFFWDDYSHRMLVNNIKEKREMNPSGSGYSMTQVSFEFICVDKNYQHLRRWNVEKCGVHFLRRQDAEEFPNKTTTIVPSRL